MTCELAIRSRAPAAAPTAEAPTPARLVGEDDSEARIVARRRRPHAPAPGRPVSLAWRDREGQPIRPWRLRVPRCDGGETPKPVRPRAASGPADPDRRPLRPAAREVEVPRWASERSRIPVAAQGMRFQATLAQGRCRLEEDGAAQAPRMQRPVSAEDFEFGEGVRGRVGRPTERLPAERRPCFRGVAAGGVGGVD